MDAWMVVCWADCSADAKDAHWVDSMVEHLDVVLVDTRVELTVASWAVPTDTLTVEMSVATKVDLMDV